MNLNFIYLELISEDWKELASLGQTVSRSKFDSCASPQIQADSIAALETLNPAALPDNATTTA